MVVAKFESVKVRAIRGHMNAESDRISIYTAEIPAKVAASFYVEGAIEEGGFQRKLDTTRASRIGRLMGGDRAKGVLPEPNVHGGLLAYADESEIEFDRNQLTIKAPLRLIDGQHRAAGARWAVEHGFKGAEDYTETVRVVVGATRPELALWYLRCNLEMRKVPPANIILDVAQMEGVVMRRKSWVSRLVVALSAEEPFSLEGDRLVSFAPNDGGRIQAQSLYRAIDILLPPNLNREGVEVEQEAVVYAHDALQAYTEVFSKWGDGDEEKGFTNFDFYSFTFLTAWARLYAAIREPDQEQDETSKAAAKAFTAADLDKGTLPVNIGSGERASSALATFAAAKAGLSLERLGQAAA